MQNYTAKRLSMLLRVMTLAGQDEHGDLQWIGTKQMWSNCCGAEVEAEEGETCRCPQCHDMAIAEPDEDLEVSNDFDDKMGTMAKVESEGEVNEE